MLSEDIVKNKLAAMSEYLPQLLPLLELYRRGELKLNDERIFVVERLFQLIADAAIDINTHIITRKELESPDDYEGTFRIIGKHGIIPTELSELMSGSIGLRNRMVHGYEKVQRKIMIDDIANGIGQYVEYMKHISAFLDKQTKEKNT